MRKVSSSGGVFTAANSAVAAANISSRFMNHLFRKRGKHKRMWLRGKWGDFQVRRRIGETLTWGSGSVVLIAEARILTLWFVWATEVYMFDSLRARRRILFISLPLVFA